MSSHYEKMLATGEVRCIDDERPFEIPEGWEWARIENIFQINPKVKADDNCMAAFVPMEKISAGYGSDYTYFTRSWRNIKNGYTPFADGDVAFAKITPCFQNRKSVIFSGLPNGIGAGTTELKVLRQYGETMNRWFLLFFLESAYFVEEARFKGTANQQRIVQGYLESKLFPIPPLAEQHRIVAKVQKLMPIIDKYNLAQNKLDKLNANINEQLRKSILQEAIQGQLVEQCAEEGTAEDLLKQIKEEKKRLVIEGKLKKSALAMSRIYREDNKYCEKIGNKVVDISEEIPFDIPKSWTWCRFGDIVTTFTGKTPERGNQAFWSNGVFPWVSIADMKAAGVVSSTKEKVSNLAAEKCFSNISPKGSLIMSFKLTVGRTSILSVDAYHNEAIITIQPIIDCSHAFRNFLLNVLPLITNHGESKDAIKGKTLNSKSIAKLLLPLPPLAEQVRIVRRLDELTQLLK